jgi:hypothetical protein
MRTPKATTKRSASATKASDGSRKGSSTKAVATRRAAKRAHEAAISAGTEEKTCILPGSRPGTIRICKIDPATGACTKDCIEIPDPGAQMLLFVMR